MGALVIADCTDAVLPLVRLFRLADLAAPAARLGRVGEPDVFVNRAADRADVGAVPVVGAAFGMLASGEAADGADARLVFVRGVLLVTDGALSARVGVAVMMGARHQCENQ